MLVLTRKVGERVILGDGIRIQVLSVRGNCIRLGFEAPEHVAIRREELCFEPLTAPTEETAELTVVKE